MDNCKWQYLSYELSNELSNYGGAKGIEIDWLRRIDKGDSSNNSAIQMSSHTGTHIDYPLHFLKNGKSGSDYKIEELIFNQVGLVDISKNTIEDHLIKNEHLKDINLPSDIELLIIKTGFCNNRSDEKYWKYNWGFSPETAAFLRSQYPQLRAIAFDLISLSSYQQREVGREAHKEFLGTQEMLIIEDLDLKNINSSDQIIQVIVSPLRFAGADGAPVTILAKLIA